MDRVATFSSNITNITRMVIKFLNAFKGDSILISVTDDENIARNILIDSGTGATYYNDKERQKGELFSIVEHLKREGQKIDLLIITHVDDDHIGGILKWISKDSSAHKIIGQVWFNSGKLIAEHLNKKVNEDLEQLINRPSDNFTSISQGIKFETYIEEHGIWDRQLIKSKQQYDVFPGISVEILSPNDITLAKLVELYKKPKHDYFTSGKSTDWNRSISDIIEEEKADSFSINSDASVSNGSSIAFILSSFGRKFLFLSDSHCDVVTEALLNLGYSANNPLHVEFIKISHHGSDYNIDDTLLSLVNTNHYIILADGTKSNLPSKRCVARIIKANANSTISFNYERVAQSIFTEQDRIEYPNVTINVIKNLS